MNASPLLAACRVASAGLGLAGPIYLYWQGLIGRDDPLRRRERLGRSYLARPGGRLALLHAASSTDSLDSKPLIEKLGQLDFPVLLSTRSSVAGPFRAPHFPPSLHQLAPLGTPLCTARFLDHWRPDIVLISGPEIPLNLIVESNRRKIPLAMVNTRLSARTFLIWRRFPRYSESLLSRIDICLAQTNADAERLASLGLGSVRVAGSLKYDLAPAPADQSALARLLARIGTRPVWVADGTAPGEEEVAMAAHRQLVQQFPELLTVIVPLDPKRAFEITQCAAKLGLKPGLRGGDRDTAPLRDIYIAHTAGEAGLFYRCAGIVFAGKSLCHGAGKNPIEAAQLGCAILHGPGVNDFEEIFAALDGAGGGVLILDAETLAKQLALLLFDKVELRAMAREAAATAKAFGGASNRIIEAIAPYLAQAMVTARSGKE
ncbi:MAG: 3-deoxy-D-manno-octulosonic acid transferase [Beijerinckiaceae bacterium]|nr:3-deoxy-D-manno-octulosonic acid transferase [Beijerinckiaceae bacterium]